MKVNNKEIEREIASKDSRIHEIFKQTKGFLYKKLTLEEGVQSIIGITLITVAGSIGYDMRVPLLNNSLDTSSLNSATLVLWTASCSFLLFSVERMEVRSLGVRLKDILENMMPRRTIQEALAVIFMEMIVLITAEVFKWERTAVVLASLQIINAMVVFYIVLRYSSRRRALIAIKHDAHNNILKIDGRADIYETSLWEGKRLYLFIRLLTLVGVFVYYGVNVLADIVICLFMERTPTPLKKNGLDGIPTDDWLIMKMSRSIDYKNGEDCSALETMLRETLCKIEFEGQRGVLLKCIRLILSESDNSYHSAMLISDLYNSDGTPECRMNIRKAILEALLERGTQENLKMALQLGMIERELTDPYAAEELRCWRYVCMRTFRCQIQIEKYLLLNFYNEREPFKQGELLKAVSALSTDQEMGFVETLQRVSM